ISYLISPVYFQEECLLFLSSSCLDHLNYSNTDLSPYGEIGDEY
ncbi:7873_t:CDS:1, partial [Racocetra persica]